MCVYVKYTQFDTILKKSKTINSNATAGWFKIFQFIRLYWQNTAKTYRKTQLTEDILPYTFLSYHISRMGVPHKDHLFNSLTRLVTLNAARYFQFVLFIKRNMIRWTGLRPTYSRKKDDLIRAGMMFSFSPLEWFVDFNINTLIVLN